MPQVKQTKNPLATIDRPVTGKKTASYDIKTLVSNLKQRKINPKDIPALFPDYLKQCTNVVPSQANFALFLGISSSNLCILADKDEKIAACVDYLNTISEDMLTQGGLTDAYNSGFAQFILKTKHNYIDKSQAPTMAIQQNWFNLDDRGYTALSEAIKKPEVK